MDCPPPSAPGAGNPQHANVFGQQLRDAHDSLSTRPSEPATGSTSGPKRSAARGSEKKAQGDGDSKGSVPATQGNTPPSPALPLNLAVPTFGTDSADSDGASGNNSGLLEIADQVQPDAAPDSQLAPPGTQAASGDLSFALKLDPHANPDPGNNDKNGGQTPQNPLAPRLEAQINGTTQAAVAAKDARHADQEQDALTPAPRNDATARLAAFQATEKAVPADSQAPAEPHADAAKALEASAVQTPAADVAVKPSAPLKDLSIQVGHVQNDKVELRVVERSGELQVAVRASNPDLAQGLRQGLGDLVDRLEQNGFRAEAWRPGAAGIAPQATGETQQRSMQFQQEQSQRHSHSGGQQQNQQQNRQNQSDRPQWVRELQGNLNNESFAGEFNGIPS